MANTLKKWEFNVYDVADASKQRPLTYVLYELLKKYDLLTTFKVSLLIKHDSCCMTRTVWLILILYEMLVTSWFCHQYECKHSFSSIFPDWPRLYLGLNQQTNSYFIDNMIHKSCYRLKTVVFMIQATDINQFIVIYI